MEFSHFANRGKKNKFSNFYKKSEHLIANCGRHPQNQTSCISNASSKNIDPLQAALESHLLPPQSFSLQPLMFLNLLFTLESYNRSCRLYLPWDSSLMFLLSYPCGTSILVHPTWLECSIIYPRLNHISKSTQIYTKQFRSWLGNGIGVNYFLFEFDSSPFILIHSLFGSSNNKDSSLWRRKLGHSDITKLYLH